MQLVQLHVHALLNIANRKQVMYVLRSALPPEKKKAAGVPKHHVEVNINGEPAIQNQIYYPLE